MIEARRKCKYNREEHRWRCIAGADQAQLCRAAVQLRRAAVHAENVLSAPVEGGSRPSGTNAA